MSRAMNSPSRSFGIPVLYRLQSLQQQGVMPSGSVGGLQTVATMAPMQQLTTQLSAMTQSPVPQLNTAPPITETPSPPTAQLYLCRTSNNATEPPSEEGEGGKEKASLELLQHDYDNLNSRKIKDSLSSFLPDIPGDFDSVGTTNTMLKNLLEQRAIGNHDFLPLSGQALLGFRLLPGGLPEQYRIDPPSLESKHHHKRKKHKRKQIEKMTEDNGDLGPPAPKAKMPSDAFTFLKQEPQHTHYPTSQPHTYPFHGAPAGQGTSVIQQSTKPIVGSHALSQPISAGATVVASGAVASGFVQGVGHQYLGEKRKKEKKKNKEKKEKKKEKKKKRDKHHGQEPPGPGAPPPGGGASGPTLQPHPQVPFGSFPHT